MGQLLVWEWQSESYVFKQQGHFNNMASLAYSPDGQYIVTGGDDGKVSPVSILITEPSVFLTVIGPNKRPPAKGRKSRVLACRVYWLVECVR